MVGWIHISILAILGAALLWFGYTLFFRMGNRASPSAGRKQGKDLPKGGGADGRAGEVRTCPLCTARLDAGERVKSTAFPSMRGKDSRIMHISGCVYCLDGSRLRTCPVCDADLGVEDVLIARIFDKPGRSHVHVLGCSRCRKG
ncbi:MAG: hypothetical protein LBU28_05805 [Spirochaetaceae bacterium]|jgi:hypothetical protein|nr:hypothetical protein [Spirochaetaceae bacterium]